VKIFQISDKQRYSLVVFSKLYGEKDQELAQQLKSAGIRTALDLCDNHFYNPNEIHLYQEARKNLTKMLKIVDYCVCSTSALQEVVIANVPHAPVPIVIGDAIEELPPAAQGWWPFGGRPSRPVLLWQGIHGVPNAECGMLDILRIGDLLTSIASEFDFELVILSNSKAKYSQYIAPLPFRTRYVEWSLSELSRLLKQASAVLIPVTRNPFTLCKTNNRLALPLTFGVPVIADSIPSYEEFAPYTFLNRWEEGLRQVLQKELIVREMTVAGQAFVQEYFAINRISQQWGSFFTLVANQTATTIKVNSPTP